MSLLKKVIKKSSYLKLTTIFMVSGTILGIYINTKPYSSRFEAEAACNQSKLYCHHDKETRQILGLDYEETKEFKLGWPVVKRYHY